MKDDFFSGNNDDTTMDWKDDEFDIPTSPKKILDEGKQGWLHMDIPEPEKLKWMEDLPEQTEKQTEPVLHAKYNARFDFNGEYYSSYCYIHVLCAIYI